MNKKTTLIVSAIISSLTLFAGVRDLSVANINGTKYYHYKVKKGDSLDGIAKRLGVSVADIRKYNPDVKSTLIREGQDLFFLQSDYVKTEPVLAEYVAKKGDSVYGISKRFGMDQDAFLALNPHAVDGIKIDGIYRVYNNDASSEQKNPASEATANNAVDAPQTSVYAIKSGETLYSIAEDNGCHVSDILKLNPGLDSAHYEVGQEIVIPKCVDNNATILKATKKYTVKENDTFYGVARTHGVSIEQLQAANPGVNFLREGEDIIIPESCDEKNDTAGPGSSSSIGELRDTPSKDAVAGTRDSLTIAIALPFCGDIKEKDRNAKNAVDFYRGFMLAVDSLKSNGRTVTIMVFDTGKSKEKTDKILNDQRLSGSDFIIAPESADQLDAFALYGNKHDIKVLNLFSVKDTTYKTINCLYQANIPSERMINKAIEYQKKNADFDELVVLHPDGKSDKVDVVDQLLSTVDKNRVKVHHFKYSGKLSSETLSTLSPDRKYLFIPSSSKPTVAAEILAELSAFKSKLNPDGSISVFGYPDWITLKGKALDHMKEVNTTIYSRFYANPDDNGVQRVEESYQKWYGHSMPAALPRQTLAGFDVAMMLLNAPYIEKSQILNRSFNGLQSTFDFKKSDNGGYVNDGVYIINYRPSGFIDKVLL